MIHLDFETFSEVDLLTAGVYKYAEDPSTEILMAAYAINDGPIRVVEDSQAIKNIFIRGNHKICAFNANFERTLLRCVLGVEIPIERWHCTQINGLSLGFSGGLADMAINTGVSEQKDPIGKKLINKFSKIQAANRKVKRWTKENAPQDWELFKEYCKQDVATERELQRYFDEYPISKDIWEQWYLDQKINDRGLPVDMELVNAALLAADKEKIRVVQHLQRITKVENPNSVQQLLRWIRDQGILMTDLQATSVTAWLEQSLPKKVREVLELKQMLAKSSVSKYEAFKAATCRDNRIRGTLQYMGASRTGRWGGRLVQPQNFPRTPKGFDQETTILKILNNEATSLAELSYTLRGVIKAFTGKTLVVSDLSSIEGRVLPWLCYDNKKLKAIADGLDMYIVAASSIYKIPYEEVNEEQRFIGKVAELALGYQGGQAAFAKMAAVYGVKLDDPYFVLELVKLWRFANPCTVDFWAACERASKLALANEGKVFPVGRISFLLDRDFLRVMLPSGRDLYYYNPIIHDGSVYFAGTNTFTKKWERIQMYGGKWAENVTQAVSRDILAHNMLLVESKHFQIVGSIHDELITEQTPAKTRSPMVLSKLISTQPKWTPALPLGAKGYQAQRFKKE